MDIRLMLEEARDRGASDLILVAGSAPAVRVDGAIHSFDGVGLLAAGDIETAFKELASAEDVEEFYRELELDFALSLDDGTRLRCNVSRQRGCTSLAIRLFPPHVPTIDELELPEVYKELVTRPRGLIIITGPTGSGKSTSLAAMIEYLNLISSKHIVTIEDPIEYVHRSNLSVISQRELGEDTHSFAQALRHVLRQNPDVIMVGEVRDMDTAAAVLTVAETGHLVLTTGHAPSAPQALERIIDLFPLDERNLAQARLASLLVAVLCQTLVPRARGKGRIAAVEIMLASSAVRSLIRDGKFYQLPNIMRTGRDEGMVSMDMALVELHLRGIITRKTLFERCGDRDEVEELIASTVTRPRRHSKG